jgi:leucyl-tRNA synthetase
LPGLQVNGKMRGSVEVAVDISQEDAVAAAQTINAVAKQVDGKPIKKVIFVPNKILNLIVGK